MKAVIDIPVQINQRQRKPQFIISKWTKMDPHDLYALEEKTWAPWMRKPQKNFTTIIKTFPEGQIKITDMEGNVLAMISTNRINWDGKIESLSTWDAIAGGSIEKSNFSTTYVPDGNTLDIMSISVDPSMQGKGLAHILFREVINMASYLGVEYLIASFRPCLYGNYKAQTDINIEFKNYCKLTTPEGLPYDPWLRVATRYGMVPLRIENCAIQVEVTKSIFDEYKRTYNPNNWIQNANRQWECGEAGTWTVDGDKAIYCEPNIWGEIPVR